MSTFKRSCAALAMAALFLSSLMLANAPAEAQQLSCDAGALVGDQCIEEVGFPSFLCPVADDVFESTDGACYALLDKDISCPQGLTLSADGALCEASADTVSQVLLTGATCPDSFEVSLALGGVCTATVPALQAAAECPIGARGEAGACYVIEPREGECFPGEIRVANECIIVGPIPVGSVCPLAFTFDGTNCVRYAGAALLGCPLDTVEDDFGLCRRIVADAPINYQCAEGSAVLTGDECIVTYLPCSYSGAITGCTDADPICPEGYVSDVSLSVCTRSEPASQTGPTCPDGVRGAPGGCYILVAKGPAGEAVCDVGQLVGLTCVITGNPPDANGLCASGFGFLDGDCIRYSIAIQSDPQCPVNSAEDMFGYCRQAVATIDGAYFCESAAAVLAGTSCDFTTGLLQACTPGDACDDGSGCPVTFVLDGGICVNVTPAVVEPLPAGEFYCENANGVLSGSDCILTAAFSDMCSATEAISGQCGTGEVVCPFPFVPDDALGGLCYRFEPAEQLPLDPVTQICPDGAFGEPGACYLIVPKGPESTTPVCVFGDELVGSLCVSEIDPIPTQPPTCFENFSLTNGVCVGTYEPFFASAQCPLNSVEVFSGECHEPIGTIELDPPIESEITGVPGDYVCLNPGAMLVGQSCVFVTEPIPFCSGASAVCGDGQMVVQVCPLDGTIVETGTTCSQSVPPQMACPLGLEMDTEDMTKCRVEIVASPGCNQGIQQELVCVEVSSPNIGFVCDDASCDGVLANDQPDTVGDPLLTKADTTVEYSGCSGGTATFTVSGQDVVVATGTLTETSNGSYSGSYALPAGGTYELIVTVECPDGSTQQAVQTLVFIDPSGVVTDCAGDVVAGAEVTLYRSSSATGALTAVADGDATVMDPSVNVQNPTLTSSDGRYRWDVVAGFYQVIATFDGQPPVASEVLEVPPARTDVDLVFAGLNCVAASPTRAVLSATLDIETTPQAPVEVPAATPVTTDSTLAVTGSDADQQVPHATLAIGVGCLLLGLSRRRRVR